MAGFWEHVRNDWEHYSRDRLAGQPVAIELWCEAGGMVPQLQRVAYPYSVPVFSTGGFSSVGLSVEQIAAVQDSDADPELRPVRVALTAAQVREHGLPTAPPKKSDTRSRNWRGETCQLEAMPPEQLAATVRNAIRGVIDVEMFDAEVGREKQDKADIEAGLDRAEAGG